MKKVLGGVSMKRRVGLISKYLIGAALAGAASTGALAQSAGNGTDAFAADLPVKAPAAAAAPVPYWWFHGSVEAGYRDFLNHPQNGYQTATGPAGFPGVAGNSLAKYYEYSDIKPGVFGNVWLSAGTSDGLYQVDFGGKNIGYDDQAYWLDFSKAGQFYFNFGWDQTPHVYSTSALTPYVVNGNALTLNACGATGTKTTAILLAPCAQPTDIGIRRDTASGQARWTPDDVWDIKADYSHMTRTGTQVGAAIGGVAPTLQLPKPVDDLTQNYGLNAEHVGTSPWGQKLVVKLGYIGSTFTENLGGDFFTIQSSNAAQPLGARESTWPSNQANGFTGTLAADLPWKSRYVTNVNYTMMRQNDSFMPNNTVPADQTALPASSLNGAINTLLWNNQLTTKITPTLTSKLTYRYYDFQNNTPELFFALNPSRDYSVGNEYVNSLSMAYTKQNAGADLNWRPTKEWNLGVAYGFERYDYTRVDVSATNESTGKIYGDWKPFSWFTLRASGGVGARTYDNYNYQGNVGFFQWTCPGALCDASEIYATTYRQLMISNRDQYKANVSADLDVIHNVTVSPYVKYIESKYGVDPGQQGLEDARKWSAGLDITYVMTPNTSFMVGYNYDWGSSLLFGINCTESSTAGAQCVAPATLTNDTTTVNTFTAAARYAVIPSKLDTELRYTASRGADNMNLFVGGVLPTGGQFPQNSTWFQRLDATAVYTFDKEQVALMGWKGTVKAKLHYAWESNSESNWANDPLTPYSTLTGMTTTLWMAWNNPNYNVQMLSASIVASW
jgi:MtrB/PioB family decaheme-associated outer membrane protein